MCRRSKSSIQDLSRRHSSLTELEEPPVVDVERLATQFDEARSALQQAFEAVDKQLVALRRALFASDDPELHDIADHGLEGVIGHFRPLRSALRQADKTSGDARLAAARLAKDLQTRLLSSKAVGACDDNPFSVAVSIRTTLKAPLAQLAGLT